MSNRTAWQTLGIAVLLVMIISACTRGEVASGSDLPEVPLMTGPNPDLAFELDSEPVPQDPTGTALEDPLADADVLFVEAQSSGETWTFRVTIRHPDTGWEDYANGWDVVLPDGTVLKSNPQDAFTRVLLHPHVNEQPFTREQSGLVIPEEITQVTVRAHDLVSGFGGLEISLDLEQSSGEGFQVVLPDQAMP